MALPIYSTPQIERIQSLLERLAEGHLLVPRFQRDFVWKDEQRQGLLRSIYKGLPMGSIFTWATSDHQLASFEHIAGFRVGLPKPNQPRTYLLDGHQRMATLLTALWPGLEFETTGGVDDPWESLKPLYFDLEKQQFELEPRSKRVPAHWFLLSELFALGPFYAKQRELTEKGKEVLARRLEYLASVIKDYRIPVVPLVSEDLDLVTEGFKLINSAGTRMSVFHMVNALTWSKELDMSRRFADIRSGLDSAWQELDEDVLLRICKAILNLDLFENEATRIAESLKDKQDKSKQEKVFEEMTRALKLALRFLKEKLGIGSPQLLPYVNQVVFLAEALRLQPTSDLRPEIVEAVQRWFWLTTYTEYFAGISAGRMSVALDHIRRLARGEAGPVPENLENGPVEPSLRFSWRKARSRAFLWRLAALKLQASGNDLYDPFELLATETRAAVHRIIGSEAQDEASDSIEQWILLPPGHQADFLGRLRANELSATEMAAHGIDEAAASAFARHDLKEFFHRRQRRLIEDEAAFVRHFGLEYRLPVES